MTLVWECDEQINIQRLTTPRLNETLLPKIEKDFFIMRIKPLPARNLTSGIFCFVVLLSACTPKKDSYYRFSENWEKSIGGTYEGELTSRGELMPQTTTFKVYSSGTIDGTYVYEGLRDHQGKLSQCKANDYGKLTCQWQDDAGTGVMEIFFSADMRNFDGSWGKGKTDVNQIWYGSKP